MNLIKETFTLPQTVTIHESAELFRNGLLMEADGITSVTDATSQAHAAAVAKEMHTYIANGEDARQSLVAPFLDGQRKINALAKDHFGPVIAKRDKLGEMISAFQLAERERVQAEERARQAEIERLEAEQRKAQADAMAAQALAMSATEDQQVEMDIAAAQAVQAVEMAREEQRAVIVAPLPQVQKASGASTKESLDFEVTDLMALVKARPDLCKIEAKASAIKAVCKIGDQIPGLRLFNTVKTSFRR